jgi:hypothetical protein
MWCAPCCTQGECGSAPAPHGELQCCLRAAPHCAPTHPPTPEWPDADSAACIHCVQVCEDGPEWRCRHHQQGCEWELIVGSLACQPAPSCVCPLALLASTPSLPLCGRFMCAWLTPPSSLCPCSVPLWEPAAHVRRRATPTRPPACLPARLPAGVCIWHDFRAGKQRAAGHVARLRRQRGPLVSGR